MPDGDHRHRSRSGGGATFDNPDDQNLNLHSESSFHQSGSKQYYNDQNNFGDHDGRGTNNSNGRNRNRNHNDRLGTSGTGGEFSDQVERCLQELEDTGEVDELFNLVQNTQKEVDA
jgi:hypothetical protein